MLNRQRLAVHRIREQQVRVASFIKLQTALEADRLRMALQGSAVRTPE